MAKPFFEQKLFICDSFVKERTDNLVHNKNQFLLKVFDEIDGSLSVAYENGFAVVLANIVVGLAGDKRGAIK